MAKVNSAKINKNLIQWAGLNGLPNFTKIDDKDFGPAFKLAMKKALKNIDQIADNKNKPTFKNTILALETGEDDLSRISAIFWNRSGAHTNEIIQKLERDISPKMSRYASKIAMNTKLFNRIDALWQKRDKLNLNSEQMIVLERYWKSYVKSGAKLSAKKQNRLASINEELAGIGTNFGQNMLADEASWSLILSDEKELVGIPDFLKSAMAAAAGERLGKNKGENKYAVTLSRSIIEPFLTFSENRELREKAFNAFASRGEHKGKHDNRPLVKQTLVLRDEKAKLLGYKNYAELKLDNTMAKTPKAVNSLLGTVWEKALVKAKAEEDALSKIIVSEGKNHKVAPWDWRHYSEKLRQEKYDFSEAELKPYLQLENVITACFDVAERLFGLTLKEVKGVKAYHPDVRTFTVKNKKGKLVGTFLGDYFARPSKRSGAWMSAFQSQHKLADTKNGKQKPIIYNVMNFAKGNPTLLSLDDARTLFHEFGHALHGLLSNVTHPSVAGTAVSRDWVELPSQLYEHWFMVPEILSKYAKHYKTGESMPKALLKKVKAAQTFNAGFQTIEYTSSALIDMAYHTSKKVSDDNFDPMKFEAKKLKDLKMPSAIIMRHRTPHFAHVFSGDGYSAGYYSYMWSEVLDADAFKAFEEIQNPFDKKLANRLKKYVYSSGGSIKPEKAYKKFRGKLPTSEAMLEGRGLI